MEEVIILLRKKGRVCEADEGEREEGKYFHVEYLEQLVRREDLLLHFSVAFDELLNCFGFLAIVLVDVFGISS